MFRLWLRTCLFTFLAFYFDVVSSGYALAGILASTLAGVKCIEAKAQITASVSIEARSNNSFVADVGDIGEQCEGGFSRHTLAKSLTQQVPRKQKAVQLARVTLGQQEVAVERRGKARKAPVVKVIWPRWREPPELTGMCIVDGIFWSMLVACALYLLVLGLAQIVARGAPIDAIDDSNHVEGDDVEVLYTPEAYATFTARKRCWLLLKSPESGPWALALSIFVNGTIFLSLGTMVLESVYWFKMALPGLFLLAEVLFLIVFSMEWMAGLAYCGESFQWFRKIMSYIDLLAFLPSYVDVLFREDCIFHQPEHLHMLFLFRLLRLFRILRLAKLLLRSDKIEIFRRALLDAAPAVFVCAGIVSTAVFIPGVLMYHVEQGVWFEKWKCFRRQLDDGTLENACSPFQNIPNAMYWAVTTVTTVGYGDITPATHAGQAIASLSMLMAMLSIAIPVGMITNSFNMAMEAMKEEKAAKKREEKAAKKRLPHTNSDSPVITRNPMQGRSQLKRSGDSLDDFTYET